MSKFWKALSGVVLALAFVAALVLAIFVSPKVRAQAAEPERLQLPPGMQAQCKAKGGCVLITRMLLEHKLAEAAEEAAAAAKQSCRGSI